jgi:hypothetical protein
MKRIETWTNEHACLGWGSDRKSPLSVDFHDRSLWLGQKRGYETAGGCEGQPKTRNRPIPGNVNQISADGWSKSTEDRCGQAIGKSKACSPHIHRHDLGKKNHHGAVVAAIDKG